MDESIAGENGTHECLCMPMNAVKAVGLWDCGRSVSSSPGTSFCALSRPSRRPGREEQTRTAVQPRGGLLPGLLVCPRP